MQSQQTQNDVKAPIVLSQLTIPAVHQTMPRKRNHEDGDDYISRSPKRFRSHVGSTPGHHSTSLPAVILSGFKWDATVDIWITKALESYDALFMEVSLDMSLEEMLAIKNKYGIQTDFIRVICGSWQSRERLVLDLDQAIFNWTTPYLVAQKLYNADGEGGDDTRDTDNPPIPLYHGMYLEPLPSAIEQNRRELQARVWIKLSEAVFIARAHLFGDDLDTFEALIAQPSPGIDQTERVNRWIRGGSANPQLQSMNVDGKSIRTMDPWEADANKENIILHGKHREDVTMDDELAERGLQFGQTGLIPWW